MVSHTMRTLIGMLMLTQHISMVSLLSLLLYCIKSINQVDALRPPTWCLELVPTCSGLSGSWMCLLTICSAGPVKSRTVLWKLFARGLPLLLGFLHVFLAPGFVTSSGRSDHLKWGVLKWVGEHQPGYAVFILTVLVCLYFVISAKESINLTSYYIGLDESPTGF